MNNLDIENQYNQIEEKIEKLEKEIEYFDNLFKYSGYGKKELMEYQIKCSELNELKELLYVS